MRFMFLGTGGYHPTDARHTACLFQPESGLILDAGSGIYRAFPHVMTRSLDIFLTHSHLDHIMGLPACYVPLKLKQVEQICVHGTRETLDAVKEHLFAAELFPVDTGFEFCELESQSSIGLSGTISHCPLKHPGGSTGFRIDWPNVSLAYVTDTTASFDYVPFIQNVDWLIHECNFPDRYQQLAEETGHSYQSGVFKVAKEAQVSHLILTHIDPYLEQMGSLDLNDVGDEFPATRIAKDGMVVDLLANN